MFDSFAPTAFANLFRVPTRLETSLNLLSLIFSNNTACEPSTFAVIAAISYFVDTFFLMVFNSPFF